MTHIKWYSYFVYAILLLLTGTDILSVQAQDDIFTITPNNSVCVGESVIITCYLFPPSPGDYTGFAFLSFNGSTPEGFADINTQFGSIGYVANVSIPVMGNSVRIQLNVTSFRVSDSNTVFGCHAQLSSNGMSTQALESGSASLAERVDLSDAAIVSFDIHADTLIISANITHGSIDRPDIVRYTYTLNRGSTSESISALEDITTSEKFTDFDTTKFVPDFCYRISVTARNCAGGEGTVYSKYFGVPGLISDNGKFQLKSSSQVEWVYTKQICLEGDIDHSFIKPEFFTFSLKNNNTNTVVNITEFTLNYPEGFYLTLPNTTDITSGDYIIIIIYFNTRSEIPIIIERNPDGTITIILIVLCVLLTILFFTILVITVLFVTIYLKRKRKDDSKK